MSPVMCVFGGGARLNQSFIMLIVGGCGGGEVVMLGEDGRVQGMSSGGGWVDEQERNICHPVTFTLSLTILVQCWWSFESGHFHAQLSWAGSSSIRTLHWTTVLVPVYRRWGRTDLLSDSTTVGGDMPCSAGCYWTYFWLAKQATKNLASS